MAEEKIQLSIDAVLEGGSINKLTEELASGVAKATTEGGKRAQKQYAQYVTAAMEAGVASIDGDKTSKKFLDKVMNAKAMQTRIAEAWEKGDKEHAKFLERERKKDMKQLQLIAARRKANFQELSRLQDRALTEKADAFTDRLGRGVQGIFAGNIDIGGLFKGAGKATQRKGDAAVQQGKMADASKTQKMMGGMGKMMAGVGGAMMIFGGIAALVVTLIKTFIELDGRIKDMNKSFTESAGAADFGIGTAAIAAQHLSGQMETVRTSILDAAASGEALSRVGYKDMYSVLTAMNEMNYRFIDMQKNIHNNTTSMKSFADIALRAVAYGKLLGVSSSQMGGDMAKLANEWGVGLDEVSKGLHMVHREALLSGFSTKRFYSTILEVTSGLGQYNVRLTEASQLLTAFGAARGESLGAKGFQGVAAQNFGGKSSQEALKDIIVKGGAGAVADIFRDEAAAKGADLGKALDAETPGAKAALAKQFGLDASGTDQQFGESVAKKIGTHNREAFTQALSDLQVGGEAMGLGLSASGLAAAGRGGGNKDRMVETVGDLGAASRMRWLMRLPKFLEAGFKDLGEFSLKASATQRMALETSTGMSREEISSLGATVTIMSAQLETLKKVAPTDQGVYKTDMGEFQKFGDKFGKVIFDESTNSFKRTGALFDDLDSYIASMNDAIEISQAEVDKSVELAKRQAELTENLSNMIEANVAKILNKIYITLMDIWHFLSGNKAQRDSMKVNKAVFQKQVKSQQAANEKEQKAARAAMGAAKTPEEKTAAENRSTAAAKRGSQLEAVMNATTLVDPTQYSGKTGPQDYIAAVYAAAKVNPNDFRSGGGPSATPPPTQAPGSEAGGGVVPKKRAAEIDAALRESMRSSAYVGGVDEDDFGPMDKVLREAFAGSDGATAERFMDLRAHAKDVWLESAMADSSSRLGGAATNTHTANARLAALISQALTNPAFNWGEIDGAAARSAVAHGYNPIKREGKTFNKESGQYEEADDMYVPTNGRPVLLNSQDEFLAMKKGGAIDRAMGGGGGGTTIVNNYFDGPVTEAIVRKAVGEGILMAKGKPFA